MKPPIISANPLASHKPKPPARFGGPVNYFAAEEVQPEPDAEDWRLELAAVVAGIAGVMVMTYLFVEPWLRWLESGGK